MQTFDPPLNQAEGRRVAELVAALRTPCREEINPESDLVDRAFADEFRSRLLAQHVFMGNPLFQEGFEAAFEASCRQAGLAIKVAPKGQRFWDISVRGKRLSLKSSKAQSMRDSILHISKLTEAAWIQDCRTARRRQQLTLELFRRYTTEVDGIFQLRYFAKTSVYELVEVPGTLFEPILDVPQRFFRADGPTVDIPVGKTPPDFRLKLDRSDAKVTISNLRKELCVVHGTWQIGG